MFLVYLSRELEAEHLRIFKTSDTLNYQVGFSDFHFCCSTKRKLSLAVYSHICKNTFAHEVKLTADLFRENPLQDQGLTI